MSQKHAGLSPSSAHRWMRCPGSVREVYNYPAGGTRSEAAIDGTHSHKLLEYCVTYECTANSMVGKTLTDDDGAFIVTMERAERTQLAIDYIVQRVDKYGGGGGTFSEQEVNTGIYLNRNDVYGTIDFAIYAENYLEIIDFKDGAFPVSAIDNEQLEIYALGELDNLKRNSPGVFINPSNVVMTILQPKLKQIGQSEYISSVTMPTQTLLGKVHDFKMGALATDIPDAPLVPGEKQCKFCPHKGACSVSISHTLNLSGIKFGDVSITKQAVDKEPADLTDAQIAEIIEATPLLRQMMSAVADEALRRVQMGITLPGLKCIQGAGARKWSLDDDDEMAEKLRQMGIPKANTRSNKVLTPAQAEKVSWTNRKGDVKKLSKRQIDTMNKNYITKSEGSLKVVPESEKGTAVIFDASPMFGKVAEPVTDFPDWITK